MVAAVRQLTDRGFDTVDRIQHSAYSPDFLEDLAVFADKFAGYPDGCWVARSMGRLSGICFSHPGHFSAPPRPEQAAGRSGGSPDCYFIHDVAVHPAHRDIGVAKLLVAAASPMRRRVASLALCR